MKSIDQYRCPNEFIMNLLESFMNAFEHFKVTKLHFFSAEHNVSSCVSPRKQKKHG